MQTYPGIFAPSSPAFLPSMPTTTPKRAAQFSFGDLLKTMQPEEESFEDQWKASFARHFSQPAGKTYYHVMDASVIPQGTWCHNDFPYGAFLADEVDASVLAWQPTRANPSQLDADVQRKIHATLGQNAIVVPPELDEKMKADPALRRKVMENIDRVYAFHAPNPAALPALPGTNFYGTRVYGSVVILDKDGEVANCEVSSGGGMIGPDERTLRQIEQKQKRKQARREAARQRAKEAAEEYAANRLALHEADIQAAISRSATASLLFA